MDGALAGRGLVLIRGWCGIFLVVCRLFSRLPFIHAPVFVPARDSASTRGRFVYAFDSMCVSPR